jgi:CBS domain-containing protein
MRVEDLLRAKGRDVDTIRPEAKVLIAVHRMRMQNVGALVVSRGGKVEGVLSERDIVRGLTRHGPDMLEMSVVAVMSRPVPVCSPDDTLSTVMAQMTRTRNRHVPVVDADGLLCGIVSVGDVVKHRLEQMELETNVLRDAYMARH